MSFERLKRGVRFAQKTSILFDQRERVAGGTRFVRFEPIKLGLAVDAKKLAKLEKARDKTTTEEDYERTSKAIRLLGAKRASVIVAEALVNTIFLRLHKVCCP